MTTPAKSETPAAPPAAGAESTFYAKPVDAAVPPDAAAAKPVVDVDVPTPPEAKAEADAPAPEAPAPDKVDDPNPAPNEATEKYDLKLPEGTVLDPSNLEAISDFAKSLKLTNEQAQALVDNKVASDKAYAELLAEAQEKQTAEWKQAVLRDPEIGGEAAAKNAEVALRVLKRFGTDSLMQELETTGYGNHPELTRLLVRIGKAAGDDTLISPPKGPSIPKKTEDIFYPKEGV